MYWMSYYWTYLSFFSRRSMTIHFYYFNTEETFNPLFNLYFGRFFYQYQKYIDFSLTNESFFFYKYRVFHFIHNYFDSFPLLYLIFRIVRFDAFSSNKYFYFQFIFLFLFFNLHPIKLIMAIIIIISPLDIPLDLINELWVNATNTKIWFIFSNASDNSWTYEFSNYKFGALTTQPWMILLQFIISGISIIWQILVLLIQ